jgi:hypothetical protein
MYSSEAELRKALCKELESKGFFTQKLEVEGMNVGVPDLFIGRDYIQEFIELKLEKTPAPKKGKPVKVHWRPGQQAWAYRYYKSVHKPVFTVIQYSDRLAVLTSFGTVYKDGIVDWSLFRWFSGIKDFVSELTKDIDLAANILGAIKR